MNITDTINELENRGFEVNVKHVRVGMNSNGVEGWAPAWKLKEENMIVLGKGGQTLVSINAEGQEIAFGLATCCEADNFNKRVGTSKALGRAIGDLKKTGFTF